MTTTLASFLRYPLEQWSPEALISRCEDKSIRFQTTMHRSLIAATLIREKEKLQKQYDEVIGPLLDLQKRIREEFTTEQINEDNLSEDQWKLITKNIPTYLEAINNGTWVLPVEGFIEPDEETPPSCLGWVLMNWT